MLIKFNHYKNFDGLINPSCVHNFNTEWKNIHLQEKDEVLLETIDISFIKRHSIKIEDKIILMAEIRTRFLEIVCAEVENNDWAAFIKKLNLSIYDYEN